MDGNLLGCSTKKYSQILTRTVSCQIFVLNNALTNLKQGGAMTTFAVILPWEIKLIWRLSHREYHYTKYYKLVVFIVDMIFILSLACSYCNHFTVTATDRIVSRRIKGESRWRAPTFVHIVINVRQGGGISRFISREGMADIYWAVHRTDIWLTILLCITKAFD